MPIADIGTVQLEYERAGAGEPITSYASSSSGADHYRQLAKEVLARCLDA